MAVALHKKVPHVLSRYDTDFLDFFGVEKSVSYQKKGGRGHARPSFFWYDNDSGHNYGTFLHEAAQIMTTT